MSEGDDQNKRNEEDENPEWEGIGQEGDHNVSVDVNEEARPGTKPKKPPTGEELRAIKDATDLFRSSSFKLQVAILVLAPLKCVF